MNIRLARPDDAERIHSIHADAIRVLCGADYTPRQVESWVRFRSVEEYRQSLTGGEANWVACDNRGVVIGYATYVAGELTALFVDPLHARAGAGRALLAVVEAHAVGEGASRLKLQSTLTSRRFYERMGYAADRDEAYTLPDGVTIACVRMWKRLRQADAAGV